MAAAPPSRIDETTKVLALREKNMKDRWLNVP
jgi:hypothetical protein